jgi:hypothetical protein
MTVCIAAIAADSKAIVCIADRALTFSGTTASAETDSGVTKIVDVPGTSWCAMFSGDDLTFPERVLGLLAADIAKDKPKQCDRMMMEKAVKKAFEARWQSEVEDHVLKPKLLSVDSFTADPKDARLLDTVYLNILAEEIAGYAHNCSMLFCGFDSNGPHIFTASTPAGQLTPCDWQGFQAIGAGEETARNHLIWSEFDKDDSLESVLYDVFNAKVATEVLQGVGYAWNWRIIVAGHKPKPLPKRIDKLIDRVWVSINRSPYSPALSKKDRAPANWKRRLTRFAEDLLTSKSRKR